MHASLRHAKAGSHTVTLENVRRSYSFLCRDKHCDALILFQSPAEVRFTVSLACGKAVQASEALALSFVFCSFIKPSAEAVIFVYILSAVDIRTCCSAKKCIHSSAKKQKVITWQDFLTGT